MWQIVQQCNDCDIKTRNSAIADKPRDAFRGLSRSPNTVPFHTLGTVSYQFSIVTLSLRDIRLQICCDLVNRVRVIENVTIRQSEFDFLLIFYSNFYLVPFLRQTAIAVENRKIFPPLVFMSSLKGFPLELGIDAGCQKNQNDGATGPTKKFDDIFSRLDRMHQRDRQTDRQMNTGRQQRPRLRIASRG